MNLPGPWQQVLSPPLVILLTAAAVAVLFFAYIVLFFFKNAPPKAAKKTTKPTRSYLKLKPILTLIATAIIIASAGYLYYYLRQAAQDWPQVLSSLPVAAILIVIAVILFTALMFPALFKQPPNKSFGQLVKFIRRRPKLSLLFVFIVTIFLLDSALVYYYSQPVRIVSAAQFKAEKGEAIALTQQGYSGRTKAKLYLLDIRSRSEYTKEHLKGSASLPVEEAIKQSSDVDIDVAVYSARSKLEEARKVADAIRKNTDPKKRSRAGRTYLIHDGFEGLKAAGLVTETGRWD